MFPLPYNFKDYNLPEAAKSTKKFNTFAYNISGPVVQWIVQKFPKL